MSSHPVPLFGVPCTPGSVAIQDTKRLTDPTSDIHFQEFYVSSRIILPSCCGSTYCGGVRHSGFVLLAPRLHSVGIPAAGRRSFVGGRSRDIQSKRIGRGYGVLRRNVQYFAQGAAAV